MPMMGGSNSGQTAKPAKIIPTLKKTGANAGTPKWRSELSIPMATAESETMSRNGNMIRAMRPVSSALPGTLSNPGAMMPTINGVARMPAMTTTPTMTSRALRTRFPSRNACLLVLVDEVIGEHGDEGRRKCPFGEEVAEEVGDPEGGDERVRGEPGAEKVGEDLLADEAEQPGNESRGADEGRGPGDFFPGVGQAAAVAWVRGKVSGCHGAYGERGYTRGGAKSKPEGRPSAPECKSGAGPVAAHPRRPNGPSC